MAAMTQLAKLSSGKRRAAEDGLHSLLTMNNEMSETENEMYRGIKL